MSKLLINTYKAIILEFKKYGITLELHVEKKKLKEKLQIRRIREKKDNFIKPNLEFVFF